MRHSISSMGRCVRCLFRRWGILRPAPLRNITDRSCLMSEALPRFPHMAVYGAEHIQLGANVSFNNFCHLTATADAPILIGDDVMCGPFLVMNTGDHGFESGKQKIRDQRSRRESIIVGNDVWLAARVTVLRGARIPDGCVIGACSLVTRHNKLTPYSVWAGTPLRKIGERTGHENPDQMQSNSSAASKPVGSF